MHHTSVAFNSTTSTVDEIQTQEYYLEYGTKKIMRISEKNDILNTCRINQDIISDLRCDKALGYKVVTGPRSFSQAMRDPKWSGPCEVEKSTITEES